MKVYCYIVIGTILDEFQADVLYQSAKRLMRQKKKHLMFKQEDMVGTVRTDFKSVNIAGTCGIYFEADFSCSEGDCTAKFMVRDNDDFSDEEKAQWHGVKKRRKVNPSIN